MMRTNNTTRRRLVLLSAALLVAGVSACGGDDSGDDATTSPAAETADAGTSTGETASVAVTIENFTFAAQPVTADQPFEVENKDSAPHTFTADDGTFDVQVAAGATEPVEGLAAGTYAFHCTIHPNMTGSLQVG